MKCELIPLELSAERKAQVCGILSVGCDRQTAADFVGCSLADIRRAMQRDAHFLASVRRAEAGAELSHMRNIQEVSSGKKDWRASVWWLERRSPERYGKRGPGEVTTRQLKAFVAIVSDAISDEVQHDDDLDRVIARLGAISEAVDELIRDGEARSVEPASAIGQFATDGADAEPGERLSDDLAELDAKDGA